MDLQPGPSVLQNVQINCMQPLPPPSPIQWVPGFFPEGEVTRA